MSDQNPPSPSTPTDAEPGPVATPRDRDISAAATDRIAKVMARSGVASRREAERMILEGRVSVNGQKIDSPALDVGPSDRIMVDGKKLDEPQETRLWLYYKPLGLVTSESDEKGRQTVFDALPRDLPRVMTVGRLDLNSEGLLLLTNDGELKRRLELPSTGWLRRYRVRVNGSPSDMTFDTLRRGTTIEGEDFAPMEIKLDSQQGANAWLTVGIREGRNREIRRAMAHVGLQVNRLIRIGYGPFKLTGMEKNEVVEVKRKVLRDQLGGLLTGDVIDKEREMRPRGAEGTRRPRVDQSGSGRPDQRPFRKPDGSSGARPGFARDEGKGRPARSFGARVAPHDDAGTRSDGGTRSDRGAGDRPFKGRPRDDRAGGGAVVADRPRAAWKDKPARPRSDAAAPRSGDAERPRRSFGDRPDGRGDRAAGTSFAGKPGGKPAGKPGGREFGPRDGAQGGSEGRGTAPAKPRSYGEKPGAGRDGARSDGFGPKGASRGAAEGGAQARRPGSGFGAKPDRSGPRTEAKQTGRAGAKPSSGAGPARQGGAPAGGKPAAGKPNSGRPGFAKPGGGKPSGAGPAGRKPAGGKPGGRPGGGPRGGGKPRG